MLIFMCDERGRLQLEDRLEWNGTVTRDLIPRSDGNSVMYMLVYDRIQNYLYWKYPKLNILDISMMAQSRTKRVIHCWDGKPEISNTYKEMT